MKLILLSYIIAVFLSVHVQAQNVEYKTPDDLYRKAKIELKSTTKQPIRTGIIIEKNEYVYFEVSNNKISLGTQGQTYADGNPKESLIPYRKYSRYAAGSVVCIIANGQKSEGSYGTQQMFSSNWQVYWLVRDASKQVADDYIPGNYFLSDFAGELLFDLNDNDAVNNTGTFTITVYTLKYKAHLSRNKFNRCPKTEPKKKNKSEGKYYDCVDKEWLKEKANSWYYHGINDAFRGGTVYPGCQCIYDSDKLLEKDAHEGTFDIGFWKYDGKETAESKHLHLIVDMIVHDLYEAKNKKLLYEYFGNVFCGPNNLYTLFLFDVSGSMNENNKWANAKQAAISTIDFLFDEAGKNNQTPSVGLMSYSGACVPNPTSNLLDFSTDKALIKNAITTNLPLPSGSTPTPQALQNAEAFLQQQLLKNNQCEGDLIILTDGQSTCGTIRPPGTFSQARKTVQASCQPGSGTTRTRLQTIGFDIPPGSDAEKDLQYLSSSSGGRYFHAANISELQRAFEKISRVFVPAEAISSGVQVSNPDLKNFRAGIDFIKTKNYDTAYAVFKNFHGKYPADPAGLLNYAQMAEATDRYKLASTTYTQYLQQNPLAPAKQDIERTIEKMNDYYREHFNYQKEVVGQDLGFLDGYFKKLMNGQSIPLATEFTGFINEKADFYLKLSEKLGSTNPLVVSLCNEIVNNLGTARRRVTSNAAQWDQNAVPVISTLYLKLEKLNDLIRDLEPE